jgi:hypothetical protein
MVARFGSEGAIAARWGLHAKKWGRQWLLATVSPDVGDLEDQRLFPVESLQTFAAPEIRSTRWIGLENALSFDVFGREPIGRDSHFFSERHPAKRILVFVGSAREIPLLHRGEQGVSERSSFRHGSPPTPFFSPSVAFSSVRSEHDTARGADSKPPTSILA